MTMTILETIFETRIECSTSVNILATAMLSPKTEKAH